LKGLVTVCLATIVLMVACAAEIKLVDLSDPRQREALMERMETLEEWFSGRTLRPEDWISQDWRSLDWAWYVGGVLFSLGYDVQLVNSDSTWWPLAGFLLNNQKLWFPVVPLALTAGSSSTGLAYVPLVGQGFDPRYIEWEELQSLPDNTPPVADARCATRSLPPGRDTWFLGAPSYDPDGEIVLYLWDFGDGTTARGMNVKHAFRRPGRYTVSLIVVDRRGSLARDELDIVVEETSECGCGS